MRRLRLIPISVLALLAAAVCAEEPAPDDVAVALPDADTVLTIDDWHVPADWFRLEFRSTFFRYPGATNVRDQVFAPFRNRMILHAQARKEGIDREPELAAEIDQRLASMRAYMEYQLAMTRIDLVNEALIDRLGAKVDPATLEATAVEAFYNEHIRSQPGAPDAFADVPPAMQENIRVQAAQFLMERTLEKRIAEWETNMVIRVRRDVVDGVAFPEMKGNAPPGWQPPR